MVTDLAGNPEPLKLLSSLKTLIFSLVNSDNFFATEVAQMYRATHVQVHCSDEALLKMMGLLEIELAARSQEDDEERRRKGQAHHLSTKSEAGAVSKVKGKGRGGKGKSKGLEGRSKDQAKGKAKGGGGQGKPICTDCLADNGCPRGDQCTFRHPARVGRCLRCGSTGHQLSTCRRPKRDSKGPPMAKPEAKAQSKPRANSKPRVKSTAKGLGARSRSRLYSHH